jgi:hypothetical protein
MGEGDEEVALEWPVTESRRMLEKYLHGGSAEADPDELDV